MMSKKGGLGKGLGAIFGENPNPVSEAPQEVAKAEKAAEEVGIKKISANPYQPRQTFNEEKLEELAASIKEFGIVQPLVVRVKDKGYELVAGERRLRAAALAGLKTVPVIVKDYDDAKMMEIALVENIQRHDLNPIEEAQGLRRLMQEFALTQEQAAERIGRSRSAVANILRLLNLPEAVQQHITEGRLTMGQAKQLLGLPQEAQMCEVAQAIIDNGWSARLTEEVVRKLKEGKTFKVVRELIEEKTEAPKEKPEKREPTANDVFCHDFEQRLVEFLGTKVKVIPKKDEQGRMGGTIQIEYYSAEDLERIYEVLQQGQADNVSQPAAPRKLHV